MVAKGVLVVTEGPRGCGYRKKGGKYLISAGVSVPCPALPQEVSRCPCCDSGIKPSRSWAWFSPKLFFKFPCPTECNIYQEHGRCELFNQDRAGILWIGGKFYPTPVDWTQEAEKMGVSRRISQIPKDLVVGETWVFVGHRKAVTKECHCWVSAGEGMPKHFKTDCEKCGGTGEVKVSGVFHAFQPTRIEVVVDEAIEQKEVDKLVKRGLTPVVINHVDKDGNPVDEDGEPTDEWRTIRCANPECDSVHVMDIHETDDPDHKLAFSDDRDRSEYVFSVLNWHPTNKGTFCSVECLPDGLK